MHTDKYAQEQMPQEEWNALVADVTTKMQEQTKRFVTPISQVMDDDYGELWGTGNYFDLRGEPCLLTNEHVARGMTQNSLGHQFLNNDGVFRTTSEFYAYSLPVDVAVSVINHKTWTHSPHNSALISENMWALAHEPVQGEILFFKGYSGERTHFAFGSLLSQATSYGMQEVLLPTGNDHFNPRFHFALDYRPDQAASINGDARGLPIPNGFSGSLVWNTRFVEFHSSGKKWGPECAVVTGLIWGWPSSNTCLIATKIEYVRSVLLRIADSLGK